MSSNLNSAALPAPATKVGGMRLPAPYKHAPKDDSTTPQTNLETALSSNPSNQDLGDALGLPIDNPTITVRDAMEHPKANASTYHPSGPRKEKHESQRTNAHNLHGGIQQPGGAYGQQRH